MPNPSLAPREGLTSAEVERRRAEYGINALESARARPPVLEFLSQFFHFFALLLWAAAVLAFVSDHWAPGQGMSLLGSAIVAVILINGLFSFWQHHRAERALAALSEMLPPKATVLRDGTWQEVNATALVPGDIVSLAEGDSIPADCRLLEASGIRVNNAPITGESVPETRNAEPSSEPDLRRARNIVLTGTTLVAGRGIGEVFAIGMKTEFGRIAQLTQQTAVAEAPLQREVRKLSYLIAAFSIILGAVFFWIGQRVGLPFWENALFAIGVIVANVPEGLLPTVTLALAMAAQRMARKNALVRHLPAVQSLGSATVICTDKTGTLTENRMKVIRVVAGQSCVDGAGTSFKPTGNAFLRLCQIARHCHDLLETETGGRIELIGDPMEIALVEMSRPFVHEPPHSPFFKKTGEIPFESDRKRLTTVHESPGGLLAFTKGAPEIVLRLCSSILVEGGTHPITEEIRKCVLANAATIAREGLRVLAFAYRPASSDWTPETLEQDLIFVGLAGLQDPPRPGVFDAIARCHQSGIRIIMVTGDHPVTAEAIARQIGLTASGPTNFITGLQLTSLSDEQLKTALADPATQFARLTSDQKLRIVLALKKLGHTVAVTGDGVNDAPALKEADVGVAMGKTGTDVARQSADLVLLDDHFATIVDAIEEGRTIFLNVRKFLTYILTSNVPELIPFLAFSLFKVPLALNILNILLIDLGTDILPALALGAEKPRNDVMKKSPWSFHAKLVDAPLLLRSYGFLGVLEAAGSMAMFFTVLTWGGWRLGSPIRGDDPLYRSAVSACLSTVILMQMMNIFLCRSEEESAFHEELSANRLILVGLATEFAVILFVNYTRTGNRLFSTAPVPGQAWPLMLLCAIAMLGAEELRKLLKRRHSRI